MTWHITLTGEAAGLAPDDEQERLHGAFIDVVNHLRRVGLNPTDGRADGANAGLDVSDVEYRDATPTTAVPEEDKPRTKAKRK